MLLLIVKVSEGYLMNLRKEIEKYVPYDEVEAKDKEVILKYMDTFDNLLVRDNEFAHFTASNWIVNKERTKVLMIYHNIYKTWAWTGGHSDGEEDLLKVALKEAEEETGIKNFKVLSNGIYSLEILGVNAHEKRGKRVATHLHLDCCFLLEADEKDVIRIKEDENSGVQWMNIEDVVKNIHEEQIIPIYNKLNDKLKNIKL